MKILITGAAGGIGSLITEELSQKHDLFLVDNFRNGFRENLPGFQIHEIDICKPDFITFVKNIQPDLILHLAAITSLPDCEINKMDCIEVNVSGTINVLEAARMTGVQKIIFASTSAIYENNDKSEAPFHEDLSVNPLLFYCMSKKMAEDVCHAYIKNYGMNIMILRFFNIFGPNQDNKRKSPPLLNYLVTKILNDEQPILHSDGYQERDYVSAYDLVKLFDKIVDDENFESKTYNVCSGKTISVRNIVEMAEQSLNKAANPIFRSSEMLWDSYQNLFETYFPLKKNIVVKEVNKFSLGTNEKLYKRYGWQPNPNLKQEFNKVIIKLAERIKNEV